MGTVNEPLKNPPNATSAAPTAKDMSGRIRQTANQRTRQEEAMADRKQCCRNIICSLNVTMGAEGAGCRILAKQRAAAPTNNNTPPPKQHFTKTKSPNSSSRHLRTKYCQQCHHRTLPPAAARSPQQLLSPPLRARYTSAEKVVRWLE